jgi:hypothetical protein
MPANRKLEMRLSGRLADLLNDASDAMGKPALTVARIALEIGLQKLKADQCNPPRETP